MEKEFPGTGRARGCGHMFSSHLPLLLLLLSLPQVGAEAQGTGVEILNYDIFLDVYPKDGSFHSVVELTLRSSGNAGSAVFALDGELEVEGASAGDRELRYSRKGDKLLVFFELQLRSGEKLKMRIAYSGETKAGADHRWGAIGEDTSYMIYESLWYPSIHGQRAPARISITAPRGYQALSSGELVTSEEGERAVYTYEDPVPAYGLSFVVGKFRAKAVELFQSGAVSESGEATRRYQMSAPKFTAPRIPGKSIEILCFMREEDFSLADHCLSISKRALEFYAMRFGPYPYRQFAVVEMPENFFGGHGDQGFILIQSNVLKSRSMEFIAHEIAHNWWGAHIAADGGYNLLPLQGIRASSMGTASENLWLNEGFATYSSMLFMESENGRRALVDSIKEKRREYLDVLEDSPISKMKGDYGSPEYHAILYSKGALVMHMLRYVVGEDSFWEIMREYIHEYGGKSASLGEFQALAEARYGDLDWFFEGWIHGTGAPDYAVGGVATKKCGGLYCTSVRIEQSGSPMKMPLDVTLATSKGEETKRVWIDGPSAIVEFESNAKPASIELDKEYWILEEDRTNNLKVVDPLSFVGIKALVRSALSKFD